MAHWVTCVYCKQKFDRDKEYFTQISNMRYAHKKCADKMHVEKSKAEKDYDALIDYVEKLLGEHYVAARVTKQIKDFREAYNYTYSGMLGTLVYWFEIKKAPIDKANGGIGIIPYIYEEAKQYYDRIDFANKINENVTGYKLKMKEITIAPPQREALPQKLFKLEEEEK